jgi:hypothetical protein
MVNLYKCYSKNNNFYAPIGELPDGELEVSFQADKGAIMESLWQTLEQMPGFDPSRPKPRLDFNAGWFDNWVRANCQLYASIEAEVGGTIERWHQTDNLMYLVHRPSGASVSHYSG